ncbi:PilZ domain-containing protein [Kaarinaea lacus]
MLTVFDGTNESRLYTRVEARIPVSIIYNNVPIADCYTKNISVGGLFVEVHDLGLSVNSLIQVRFNVDMNNLLYNMNIPAIVKRIEANGIAVVFERIEQGAAELIQSNINHSRHDK